MTQRSSLRGREITEEMIEAGAQALANDFRHSLQPLKVLARHDADRFRRHARLVLEAAALAATPAVGEPAISIADRMSILNDGPAGIVGKLDPLRSGPLTRATPAVGGEALRLLNAIIEASQDFRRGMPHDWEGDPLQDAIDDARAFVVGSARSQPASQSHHINHAVMTSIGEDLPNEMARIRAMMPAYRDIGPSGIYALRMMQADLDRAAAAIAEGDLAQMIYAYQALKGYEL